jgi:hypothetical protein
MQDGSTFDAYTRETTVSYCRADLSHPMHRCVLPTVGARYLVRGLRKYSSTSYGCEMSSLPFIVSLACGFDVTVPTEREMTPRAEHHPGQTLLQPGTFGGTGRCPIPHLQIPGTCARRSKRIDESESRGRAWSCLPRFFSISSQNAPICFSRHFSALIYSPFDACYRP